jgi:hypothetical protein
MRRRREPADARLKHGGVGAETRDARPVVEHTYLTTVSNL